MGTKKVILVIGLLIGISCGFLCSHFNLVPVQLPAYEKEKQKLEEELANIPVEMNRFVTIARLVTPAVVHIITKGEQIVSNPWSEMEYEFFKEFFGRYRRRWQNVPVTSFGSGAIVSKEGHIITNSHVVKGAKEIIVKLADKREFTAKLLGSDPKTDLAVLKIDGDNLPYVELGDSDKIAVGEWVLAVGNPFGLEQTVTSGIISAKGRANVGIADYEDFIQTDAAINPGNSGGPLVNMEGKVIGVNSAIVSRSGGYQGIGFAVPSNMAKSVLRDIVSQGVVKRGWLGIYMLDYTPALAKQLGFEYRIGVIVDEVVKDSPAAKAGIKKNDIVFSFNGSDVISAAQLRNLIATTGVDSKIKLKIYRGKEVLEIEATISTANSDNTATMHYSVVVEPLVNFEVSTESLKITGQADDDADGRFTITNTGLATLTFNLEKEGNFRDEDYNQIYILFSDIEPLA
ncbi:MAG: Do family serine endopeptidase, partial [Planctomycetota bacterium]